MHFLFNLRCGNNLLLNSHVCFFTSSHIVVRKDYETCGAHNPSDRSICYNREPSAVPLAFKRQELCLIYNTPKFLSHVMDFHRHAELLLHRKRTSGKYRLKCLI